MEVKLFIAANFSNTLVVQVKYILIYMFYSELLSLLAKPIYISIINNRRITGGYLEENILVHSR